MILANNKNEKNNSNAVSKSPSIMENGRYNNINQNIDSIIERTREKRKDHMKNKMNKLMLARINWEKIKSKKEQLRIIDEFKKDEIVNKMKNKEEQIKKYL